jgi:hypothetical protein
MILHRFVLHRHLRCLCSHFQHRRLQWENLNLVHRPLDRLQIAQYRYRYWFHHHLRQRSKWLRL